MNVVENYAEDQQYVCMSLATLPTFSKIVGTVNRSPVGQVVTARLQHPLAERSSLSDRQDSMTLLAMPKAYKNC
jgi:hypothetical protein